MRVQFGGLRLRKRLKVGLLFDVPYKFDPNQNFRSLFDSGEEWRDERDVVRALTANNHEIMYFPVHSNIEELISQLSNQRPDIIFFSCESVQRRRDLAHRLIGLIELLRIPYTGADIHSLQICSDKALSKKILAYHHIKIPQFEVWDGQSSLDKFDFSKLKFPVIIKPLRGEGSEGIHLTSVTHDIDTSKERMIGTAKHHAGGVIIEEYIHGRELYVGIMGNSSIKILRPREFIMDRNEKNNVAPLVATYRAKWDKKYRRKKGIRTQNVTSLNTKLAKSIEDVARQVRDALNIQGYVRLDLRIDESNVVHVLEANPNPAISKKDDFAASAANSGIEYNDLIQTIIDLGLSRSA